MGSLNVIETLSKLVLETERLSIRAVEENDLEAISEIHMDDQVNHYLPYKTWTCWNDALKWYDNVEDRRANNDAEQFVIVRKNDLSIVGTCIVFNFKLLDHSCEIGYVLNRAYWQHGYMLEAMSSFTSELMSHPNVRSLRAVVNSQNKSSLRLLSKLKFELTATLMEGNTGVSHLYLRTLPRAPYD